MVTDAMGSSTTIWGFEVVDARVPAAKSDLTLTVTDYLDSSAGAGVQLRNRPVR